ncbi:ferrous iron transporter B, partial [[Clostridium] innocuum]|nr:ferrous iron transporter B [[Clostridium] innocuum]
ALVKSAEEVCAEAVAFENHEYAASDRKLDKILTSRLTGYPVMILLLAMVFWLTITGANYPSQLLADGLFWVQD